MCVGLACTLYYLLIIGGIVAFMILSQPVEEVKYINETLGYECTDKTLLKKEDNLGYYQDFITKLDKRATDFRIGPCGHTYVRYNGNWLFEKVNPKSGGNLSPIKLGFYGSCDGCILRVDQNGNLWYRGLGNAISIYDQITKKTIVVFKSD